VRELLSKLIAGGLSAAVILLWWPRFFPAEDATTWLVRGVVWTLSFEVLMHALLPLERALWDSRAGSRVRAGASKATDRLGAPRRSLRGSAMVACSALAVPLALLTFAPAPPVKAVQTASVRHVTEVKRIVKVERKQVRVAQVVPVQAAAPQAAPVPDPAIASERPRVAKPKAGTAPRGSSGTRRSTTKGNATAAPEAAPQPQPQDTQVQQQPVSAPRVVRRAASA
jgi:hypothetical protein